MGPGTKEQIAKDNDQQAKFCDPGTEYLAGPATA